MVGWLDGTIATQEAKGMQSLLVGNVFVNLLFTGLILWFVYFCTDAFDFKKRGELYWLYVTLTVLVLFFIFEFTGPFLTPRRVVSVTRQTHPMYYLALARICIVNLLLILGVIVAIIKQRSTVLYGAVEVIVAVLSNIAIIAPLKLTDFPKTHFTTTDLLALGALAYLFSKGIGDVIDGVKQIRKKKLEGQPAA
jgi:hypothetical protein